VPGRQCRGCPRTRRGRDGSGHAGDGGVVHTSPRRDRLVHPLGAVELTGDGVDRERQRVRHLRSAAVHDRPQELLPHRRAHLLRCREQLSDPRFSPAESVALEYTTHFCTDSARIDDDLLARLGEHFDAGETVELTLVIAKYLAMGRFMQVLGLDQACSLQMTTAGDVVATT